MDNLENLKEQLYRKGFGTELYRELEEKINSSAEAFMIEHFAIMKNGDEMGYQLHFARSEKDGNVYFNSFTAGLLKNTERPGEIREHTFPTRFMITAAEAYRMLKHGLDVAVNKNLFDKDGEKYNTWISLDVTSAKNEFNNFPEKTYHQNYFGGQPFLPTEALKRFQTPIKEVQYALSLERLDEKLRKANIVRVQYFEAGQERTGMITINPKQQGAMLRDTAGNVVEAVSIPRKKQEEQQQQAPEQKQETGPGDEKKKPQKIEWGKSRSKGLKP